MADDNKLIFEGVLDTSNMEKQLDTLTKKKKAITGEVITAKEVENAAKLVNQIGNAETKFKQLAGAQSSFASGANQSYTAFAKVTGEMASQIKYIRDRTTDQEQYNKLIAKEVELRQQAKDAMAKSKLPGASDSGGSSGGGQSLFPGASSGLSGAAFGAVIGAFAFAAKSFADTLNEAGQKAKEFSQHISDAGGSMDKLRQSLQDNNYESSKLAHNPTVIDLEKAKTDWDTAWKKGVGAVIDAFKSGADDLGHSLEKGGVEKARKARADAIEKDLAKPNQLVGADKIQYEQLKRQGVELEEDLARQKEKLDHDFMAKHRDLALEEKEERIAFDNQVYDNKLQKERTVRNFQHDMAKLNADVEFKAGQQKYDLERSAEKRNFEQRQSDERTLAQFSKQDREQQAAFATQDRNTKLNLTLGRNLQDYGTELNRAALTGGMSGVDYLFKAQDFRKQQSRLIEDTGIEQSQANRNLGYSNFTANRDLQFKQGTERRDFNQDQALKAKEREIDLATHQYQLDQERYTLTTQYNDAIKDNAEALRRLTVQHDLSLEKFKNRESDLTFEEKTARKDYDINATRQRRSVQESKQEFAAGLYAKDPYGFDKIAQGNDEITQDLAGYLQRAGLPGYVNRVKTELDKFRKSRGGFTPTNSGDVSSQQGGYSQPGGGNGNTPIFQDTTVYDDQGNYIPQAANGMPHVDSDKLVFVHKDEAILPPHEAEMYRRSKLSGTDVVNNGLVGTGASHAGFGYGRGGATGLVPLTATNNGAANGVPLSVQPINMPGSGGGQPVQINIGNDQFHFSGIDADQLKQQFAGFRQEYLSQIKNAVEQAQGGSMNTFKRIQGYQQ